MVGFFGSLSDKVIGDGPSSWVGWTLGTVLGGFPLFFPPLPREKGEELGKLCVSFTRKKGLLYESISIWVFGGSSQWM